MAAVFNEARQQADKNVMVKLLTTLAENPEATQRGLANELGISLGMLVSYLKSCAKKGFVRAQQVSIRRWAYFVTPEGFAEKSKMVADYLHRSMTFYRDTRLQLEQVFEKCQQQGIQSIALVGDGDIAEIATLVCKNYSFNIGLVPHIGNNKLNSKAFDAFLITDTRNPQDRFDSLREVVAEAKIITIDILCVVRNAATSVINDKEVR